ncbi:MAG: ABC transporter permease subunit [Desulfurococcales archaeon]|jgi:peptide/nickel transport system permease protein|nr:ABC transporter permease subunit [Desulfurococcales archaeon]
MMMPETLRELMRRKLGVAGLIIISFIIILSLIAPLIAPYDPLDQRLDERLQPPSSKHLMGTDKLGRDIFSRILYGGRISLFIAVSSVVLATLIGMLIGLIAGYLGGRIDDLLMRITDMFMAFPSLILALAIAAMLKPGMFNVITAISLSSWPQYARMARAVTIQVKNEPYIEAAVSIGASNTRILIGHIIPMVIPQVMIQGMINLGGAILTAAGLGFLGFGVPPPTPEWGLMVSEGRDLIQSHWWISTFPGLMIFLSVVGFNLLGDQLRDIFDVRYR